MAYSKKLLKKTTFLCIRFNSRLKHNKEKTKKALLFFLNP